MTDPLDVLRLPVAPVDPDPAFAIRLRARIERALHLPPGVAVTTTTAAPRTAPSPPAPPHGAAIPYLAVADARRAIAWYVEVLAATVAYQPIVMPDGRVGHAELAVSGGALYLSDAHPEIGVVAPAQEGASVTLVLDVPDVDATVARAVEAGARLDRPPYEDHGHRNAVVVDPFGHRWMLQAPLPQADGYRHGDICYASIWTADADRAAELLADVLGWGDAPTQGISGGHERGTLFCCYAVDDVDAATDRVRTAGGSAGEPRQEPYGMVADCVDDQGMPFAVCELAGDAAAIPRPPAGGARHGDLAYVTLLVVDADRARAFYGAVLGWTFTPGRVTDGWNVEGVVPMTGLSGGHEQATGVPMWRVDDIGAAVRRVRAAGGTATDPERQPYGITSHCADDQGTAFYLGQL
ncbi:MAG: VOC family protein [Frankiaceae bacterium]